MEGQWGYAHVNKVSVLTTWVNVPTFLNLSVPQFHYFFSEGVVLQLTVQQKILSS